jgi:hypothetical protein
MKLHVCSPDGTFMNTELPPSRTASRTTERSWLINVTHRLTSIWRFQNKAVLIRRKWNYSCSILFVLSVLEFINPYFKMVWKMCYSEPVLTSFSLNITLYVQWCTQEFFFREGVYASNFFPGVSTNSVEDRGQRERGSGGVSSLVRGFHSICKWVKPVFWLGCYGCIFHGSGNSGQICQNFGISGGLNPLSPTPRYATVYIYSSPTAF